METVFLKKKKKKKKGTNKRTDTKRTKKNKHELLKYPTSLHV